MRNRITWAAGREASAPPAIPGYDKEDRDHPAHQPDPAYEKYKKGDPDAWAETPKAPPYAQGNPPSIPGYDKEDQDHPAHKSPPRFPKEAKFTVLVSKKAKKCCVIARAMLGKTASASVVEDQALDIMDWDDTRIKAALDRLGGGFLAECQDEFGPMDDFGDDDELDSLLAAEHQKYADQNDPKGKTLAPTPKTEEQARKEAKKSEDEDDGKDKEEETAERKTARKFFASMDRDRDGFVMKADWKGSPDLFDALDTDRDGILASEEVVDALAPKPVLAVAGFDPQEAAIFASLESSFLKAAKAKKSEDEEVKDDKEDKEAAKAKKAKAKKSEDDEVVDDKEEKKAKAKAKKAAEEDDDGDDDGGDDGDDDDDVEAAKKACGMEDAGMFGGVGDPMGLASDGGDILGEDDAMLAEIFGKSAADDEEDDKKDDDEATASKKAKKSEDDDGDEDDGGVDDDDDESPEEKAANKKAARLASNNRTASQRPQPRKPLNGAVRTVGGLTRTASANAEVNDLSALWESAPDVSKVFNS